MLYYSKSQKNRILSLFAFLVADLFFLAAFSLLFVSDTFSYAYYNWLKLVNAISFVLVTACLVIGMLLATKHIQLSPKTSKVLWAFFDVFHVMLILLVFVNVISFYKGVVFVLLLIGSACFSFGALNSVVYNTPLCLIEYQQKSISVGNEFVYVSRTNLKNKKFVNINDVVKDDKIFSPLLFVGFFITAVACLFCTVLFFWLFKNGVFNNLILFFGVWLTMIFVLLVCIMGLTMLLTTKTRFLKNKWLVFSAVLINSLLIACSGLIMFFGLLEHVSVVFPLVIICLLNLANLFLIYDYAKLKYVFKNVENN